MNNKILERCKFFNSLQLLLGFTGGGCENSCRFLGSHIIAEQIITIAFAVVVSSSDRVSIVLQLRGQNIGSIFRSKTNKQEKMIKKCKAKDTKMNEFITYYLVEWWPIDRVSPFALSPHGTAFL